MQIDSGNVCRSPIAEAIFIDEVQKAGIADEWEIESAAIADWQVGRCPDERALAIMTKYNLEYKTHIAKQVSAISFIE